MGFDQAVDRMKDVTALLTARYNNDLEGGKAIITEDNCIELLIGMTDFTLAMIKLICALTGQSVEGWLQSMGKVVVGLERSK